MCEDEYETNSSGHTSGIEHRINQKIIDLQSQLINHFTRENTLNENDLLRYSADGRNT